MTIKRVRAPAERFHHLVSRAIEETTQQLLEQRRLELEIDEELDARPLAFGREHPQVHQVVERPAHHVRFHARLTASFRRRERHLGRIAFRKPVIADDELGKETSLRFLRDTRGGAPRQKFRILSNVRDQCVDLLDAVRQNFGLGVRGH